MKTLRKPFFILALTTLSFSLQAGVVPTGTTTGPINQMETNQLTNRLEEIKTMDRSGLTTLERKALRKEVRSMKKATSSSGGGIYLSVGAVIIIVLLLILLL